MNKVHVPPIKIQGIKTKLVKWIYNNIDHKSISQWVEPFMGSGVVGFNMQMENSIFADSNPHLINFYKAVKNKKVTSAIVKSYLEEEGARLAELGSDHFYYIRNRFNEEANPLDFLFLNRSCFNGMIRFNRKFKFNTPYGKKDQRFSKSYITKIVNQIKFIEERMSYFNWDFKCQSFEETIKEAGNESLIYCDPPYIGRHVDYFDSWSEDDEQQLLTRLSNSNSKFIVSTWAKNRFRDNPYLDTLWQDYNKVYKEHFYFLGGKEVNRNSMTEALIMNFEPLENPENIDEATQIEIFK